jgi:RimJ/RimL family protein N-acetyltransferase
MIIQARVLEGRHVRLEPFTPDLKEAVRSALDCDAEAWALVSATSQGPAFDATWDKALLDLETGEMINYAVRLKATGQVVGRSAFLAIRTRDLGVEIGSTFLHPDVRSGPVNPEAKLLMLSEAFASGAMRVELRTDLLNLRSQAAIAKLGALREGVLRRHVVTWTGRIRDTVVFAITDEDWPRVRERLEQRLRAAG